MKRFSYQTDKHNDMIEITDDLHEWVQSEGFTDGVLTVFNLHTTAGITINENADPDVKTDFLRRMDETFPWHDDNDRHGEGNSAAHMKASTVGASETLLVEGGKLVLGTWQGVYFCEFDGPRRARTVVASFQAER
ncbi:secondary thiamine-phosphate synthase enzyme YjbQ [Geomicrobium sp. JSM 1781026]|uniref:secondary thiamine-phosphate synthase enzyme YjbQ n=1 Tax=Geomicrobium sp. JSM 1781026 TaxID=3344580 RepID=UPI0035C22DE8